MAAKSLNKVQLIGNLTRDPELRYTPSGTAVVTFGVATNRNWVTETGEKKEEAEFHRIVAWSKLAEIISQLLVKGRKVYIEGRLQTRSWTGKDGMERQTTEIVASDMIILDPKGYSGDSQTMEVKESGTEEVIQVSEGAPTGGAAAQGDQTPADDQTDDTKKKKTSTGSENEEVNPDEIPF